MQIKTYWFILAMLWIPSSFASAGESINGRVVGVTDGDTIVILDSNRQQYKVRLAGIDAPEKKQAFGSRSRQSLSELAFGRTAAVQFTKKDRYGRIIGKVLVNGSDVSLEQVRRGMAWHYKLYEKEQSFADRQAYSAAETNARGARQGLWSASETIPPWEYRNQAKRK